MCSFALLNLKMPFFFRGHDFSDGTESCSAVAFPETPETKEKVLFSGMKRDESE